MGLDRKLEKHLGTFLCKPKPKPRPSLGLSPWWGILYINWPYIKIKKIFAKIFFSRFQFWLKMYGARRFNKFGLKIFLTSFWIKLFFIFYQAKSFVDLHIFVMFLLEFALSYLKFIYFKTILKWTNIWEKFLLLVCFLTISVSWDSTS